VDERGAGSGGVWVTLLSLIAVFLFLLGVAAKNDWHLDLKNFGHMLEVAIQDEAYVPRPEWQKGSTVSEVEGVAVSAENVVAHWIKRDKAGPLILIKATVVNHQDSPIARVQVSTEILDGGGDVIYKSEQRVEPKIGPKRLSQTGARDALAPLIRRVPISLGTKGRKRVHLLVDAKQAGVASEGDLSYRVQVAKGKIP
jgi:hypothetical protein